MKRSHTWIGLAALSLFVTAGCPGMRPRPLQPPGPVPYQQFNATVHDPYVDQDAGPEVVGGRPREYMEPRAEPVRSRTWRDGFQVPGF